MLLVNSLDKNLKFLILISLKYRKNYFFFINPHLFIKDVYQIKSKQDLNIFNFKDNRLLEMVLEIFFKDTLFLVLIYLESVFTKNLSSNFKDIIHEFSILFLLERTPKFLENIDSKTTDTIKIRKNDFGAFLCMQNRISVHDFLHGLKLSCVLKITSITSFPCLVKNKNFNRLMELTDVTIRKKKNDIFNNIIIHLDFILKLERKNHSDVIKIIRKNRNKKKNIFRNVSLSPSIHRMFKSVANQIFVFFRRPLNFSEKSTFFSQFFYSVK